MGRRWGPRPGNCFWDTFWQNRADPRKGYPVPPDLCRTKITSMVRDLGTSFYRAYAALVSEAWPVTAVPAYRVALYPKPYTLNPKPLDQEVSDPILHPKE